MDISVAMATYNGERFLKEQLESLASQTRMPDELVACDDRSTDRTVDILEQFKRDAPFRIRTRKNNERLGYSKNFERAIGLCKGDIIFPSDQDDVWFPKKIERIEKEFRSENKPLVVINDCELTDGNLNSSGFSKVDQIRSAGLSTRNFVSGCCTALHASMRPLIIPVPVDHSPYDVWINRLALALGKRQFVSDVLQSYRRHHDNASEWFTSSTEPVNIIDRFFRAARNWNDPKVSSKKRIDFMDIMINRFQSRGSQLQNTPERQVDLQVAIKRARSEKVAAKRRLEVLNLPKPLRIIDAFKLWYKGAYEYFSGWKSMGKDIIA